MTIRLHRAAAWTLVWVALVGFAILATPIAAQDGAPDEVEGAEETMEDSAVSADDFQAGIAEDILFEEEEMLAGGIPSYDPAGRRDPFRSLLVARDTTEKGPRAEGVPGLLIGEIDLVGVFLTESGPVAQVYSSAEGKSYLLRPGDQLFDGDVVNVSLEDVVFKQIVDDPTALKPFREVVKRLSP